MSSNQPQLMQSLATRGIVHVCYGLAVVVGSLDPAEASKPTTPFEVDLEVAQATRSPVVSTPFRVRVTAKRPVTDVRILFNTAAGGDSPQPAITPALRVGQSTEVTGLLVSAAGARGVVSVLLSGDDNAHRRQFTLRMPFTATDKEARFGPTQILNNGAVASSFDVQVTTDKGATTAGYVTTGRVMIRQQDPKSTLAKEGIRGLSTMLRTEGDVTLIEDRPLYAIREGDLPSVNPIKFAVAAGGRGTIIAELTGTDLGGIPRFSRKNFLYVYAHPRKLYTSRSSFLDIDIQRLKDDRAANVISEAQYQRMLRGLLSGQSVPDYAR